MAKIKGLLIGNFAGIVTDGRTLKAMINRGLIKEAKYEFLPFVEADLNRFEYKGNIYKAKYLDGNFYPLIFKQEI